MDTDWLKAVEVVATVIGAMVGGWAGARAEFRALRGQLLQLDARVVNHETRIVVLEGRSHAH